MLDTNIVSFLTQNKPTSILDDRVDSISQSSLCISVITKAELLYGLAFKPAAVKIHVNVRAFLVEINTLLWDNEAAETYGVLRASLRRRGTMIGDMDLLIASHALAVQATLVTNDKNFRHIEGLATEDWTLPQT